MHHGARSDGERDRSGGVARPGLERRGVRRQRLSPLLQLQRDAGNAAVTKLVRQLRAPGAGEPPRSSEVIQRKLGLELELEVLVDHKGSDAGTKTELGTVGSTDLAVDHSRGVRARKVGEYSSIIELVTEAFEFEADSRRAAPTHTLDRLLVAVNQARMVAETMKVATADFTRQTALSELFPGTKPDYFIGVPNAQMITGAQNLTAYIQASMGIDLANLSRLYEAARAGPFTPAIMEGRPGGTRVKATGVKTNEDEATVLTTAPSVAAQILEALDWTGDSRGFAELRGLVTLMVTYLILGQRHPRMLDRRVIDKNIAPFLSRTPLDEIVSRILSYQDVNQKVGLAMMRSPAEVVATICKVTGRRADSHLIPEFTTTPVCGDWIAEVLGGGPDKFTRGLDSGDFKQLRPEPVGPGAPPGTKDVLGPVLEFRQPRLGGMGRVPPDKWVAWTQAMLAFLRPLNVPP